MNNKYKREKVYITLTEPPLQKVGDKRIPKNTDKPENVKSTKKY